MDLLTEPVTAQPRAAAEPLSATDWLDSFASGASDQETFFHGVGAMLLRAPDAGWEMLALIDQYYRRGKIDAAAFNSLKTHLQNLLMRQNGTGEISVPLRHSRPERMVPAGGAAANTEPRRAAVSPAIPAPPAPTHAAAAAPPPPPVQAPASRTPLRVPPSPAEPVAEDEAHAERSLVAGDVLRGRYQIVALLGQGGMGSVFEAVDQYRLDRSNGDQRVALKVLHTAVIQRPRLFAELRREFQHLQSLTHPNIVRVHEFDRDGDLAFFTMEYLSGVLLTRVIATYVTTSLYRPYAFSIIRDVGAAVVHAHARGVVHGDLNPRNIFITDNGDVRVLDFGAAHQLRRTPWISDFEGSQQITVATPRFASCQLLEGETADARDDVYALACIAYVLLTGTHPYRDQSALKARTLRLKPARPNDISRRQWNALRAGLEFERDRRPIDIPAWLRELSSDAAVAHLPELPSLLSVRPPRRTGRRWMIAAAALLLVAIGVWGSLTHVDELRGSKTAAGAKFKKTFANTVLSQLWDDSRGRGAVPASDAPAPLPGDAAPRDAAPEVATVAIAPHPKTAPKLAVAPDPTPPQLATRNGPRPLADTVPVAPIAPAAGSNPIHARIELAADNIDVEPGQEVAHVTVRRTRTLRGDVSFSWWTESGTAKPGRDFTPIKTQIEHIEDGKNAADLAISLLVDPSRHDPRSFYIVIDEASDNAALGPRTLTMVTLPGTE